MLIESDGDMTVKSSISLTDDQDSFARSLVEAGRYTSVSAVIQRGLDLLRQKTEREELELAALRLLLERRRSGTFVSGEQMNERLSAIIEAKRREDDVSS